MITRAEPASADRRAAPLRARPRFTAPSDEQPWTQSTWSGSSPRCFQIGVVGVCVSSQVAAVANDYWRLYHCWQTPPDTGALHVSVVRGRSRWTGRRRYIIRGGEDELFRVKHREQILPHLEWAINWQVVRHLDRFLQIHAAVVCRDGGCLVLPGSPQSGKTTLCAGLVARGWRFLSDEFALIDPQTLRVYPYPKAMCIKSGSFAVVRRSGWALDARTRYKKGRKGRVAYLSVSTSPNLIGSACPIRWVAFPRYAPNRPPRVACMSRGHAAFMLRQLSFNFDRFGDRGLGVISRAVRGARTVQLESGDLADTCDLIDRWTSPRTGQQVDPL